MISNTLKQRSNDNLKESLINNTLKQPLVNNILKEPTINNKEFLTNDILNDNDITNNNNIEELKINNDILNEQSAMINNNLEEPKITINNLEEPQINKKESTFGKTSEFLKSKRAILNPHNTENKSFQYLITLSLYHEQIGKNYNRVSNIKPYINNFNWENINFPPTQQDYKSFEMNSTSVALNILTINDQEKISYLRESQFNNNRKKQAKLSLLENKHYTSVKSLKSLLSQSLS